MIYRFSKEIYTKEALISAAYRFTDRAYLHLDADDTYFIVDISMKFENKDIEEVDFVNEILAQMVRHEVQFKTKNIRELIMARSFSSTMIENSSSHNEQCESIDVSEILVDWFDKYE